MKLFSGMVMVAMWLVWVQPLNAQPPVKRTKVTKKISIELPETFLPMTRADMVQKYVSDRVPIAMYTTQDRLTDFGINSNSSPWQGDDLQLLRSFYKSNIGNLFTEVNFLQEDIREINGRQFIVFEFVGKVMDESDMLGQTSLVSKYIYIQYTVYQERILLFNFSTPSRAQGQWQPVVRQMMESVQIKD